MKNESVAVNCRWKGLTGSGLKWIAIITMLIDHLGASLIEVYLMNGYGNAPWDGFRTLSYETMMVWYHLDRVLRCIGRVSFPIFCFLLVEGFFHTRSKKKYAIRLGIFVFLSEIPFDLAFFGEAFHWEHQNVFLTLFLALIGMWSLDYFRKRGQIESLFGIVCIGAAALCADWFRSDYGSFGILLIVVLYLFRSHRGLQAAIGAVLLLAYGGTEGYGMLAFLPILLYNGKRGTLPKHFVYMFYPLHLLILIVLGRWILPILFG